MWRGKGGRWYANVRLEQADPCERVRTAAGVALSVLADLMRHLESPMCRMHHGCDATKLSDGLPT